MSDSLRTNPANRAAIFLHEFRQYAPPPSGSRSQRTVRHALARMYKCDSENNTALMQIVGELWKIPNQIRTDLESIESLDPAPFTHVVVNFEKVLSWLVLDSDALGIINNMPPGLESSLGMISAYLNVSCPEASLSEDSLDELMESVSQLMDDVKAANLDGNFTDFFLHRLDELHYALNHYNTLGPDEVLRKVDELFGSILRQYPSIQRSPKKQDIAKKVFKIGTAILLAIQIVNGGFELAENYQQFIAISPHESSDSQTNTQHPQTTPKHPSKEKVRLD